MSTAVSLPATNCCQIFRQIPVSWAGAGLARGARESVLRWSVGALYLMCQQGSLLRRSKVDTHTHAGAYDGIQLLLLGRLRTIEASPRLGNTATHGEGDVVCERGMNLVPALNTNGCWETQCRGDGWARKYHKWQVLRAARLDWSIGSHASGVASPPANDRSACSRPRVIFERRNPIESAFSTCWEESPVELLHLSLRSRDAGRDSDENLRRARGLPPMR